MTDSTRSSFTRPLLLWLLLGPLLGAAWGAPEPEPAARAPSSVDVLEARLRALGAAPDPEALASLAEEAGRLAAAPEPEEAGARLRLDRARYLVGRVALARAQAGDEARFATAAAAFRALAEGGPLLGREASPTDNEWLRHFAYLGLVEALAGTEPAQALELAEDLCGVDWWYSPEAARGSLREADPETRAKLEGAIARDRAHLQRVCREAHTLRARLLLARGRGPEALRVVASLEERRHGRGWRERAGAIELVALGARAKVQAGEIEAGIAELVRVLEALDPKLLSPEESSRAGEEPRIALAQGCVALAALARAEEASLSLLQSPAASFYAAYGDQRQGRAERSLLNYRRVLHLARTPAERERWVPRAVREVGAQLFRSERYLEAALAYELVCSEFPDHAFATDAALYATSALKRAGEQLGSPPGGTLWDLRRRVEGSVGKLLSPQLALRTRLGELAELSKAGRWSQAADGYAEVAKRQTDSPLRVRVLREAGRSAWRAYREPPRRLRDPRVLERSRQHLQEAIQVASARSWTEDEAAARRQLAAIEVDLGNLLAALELLEPFEARLSKTPSAFTARQLQARALLKQGGPGAADAAERCFAAAGAGAGDARARFAYQLVSLLRSWGETRANQTGRPAERRAARKRAARYAAIYLESERQRAGSLSGVRLDVLSYLARVCKEGGAPTPALAAAEEGLARLAAAAPTRPQATPAWQQKAARQRAELERIRALAAGSLDPRVGIPALRRELQRARLRPRGGGKAEPVVLVSRRLSRETYPMRGSGGAREVRAWHTTIERAGQQEVWVEVKPASRGDTRLVLIPGRDPNAQVLNSQVRVLELTETRDLELLSALEASLWKRYRATGSLRLLTEPQGLSEVLGELLSVVRGASDASYLAQVGILAEGSFDRGQRLWEIRLSCLRLKLARQRWAEVESEIRGFELLGTLKSAPPAVRSELKRLRAEARAKSPR